MISNCFARYAGALHAHVWKLESNKIGILFNLLDVNLINLSVIDK